jgi:hypothetical protein
MNCSAGLCPAVVGWQARLLVLLVIWVPGQSLHGHKGQQVTVSYEPVPEASGQYICDVVPSTRHVPGTFRLYGTYGCRPAIMAWLVEQLSYQIKHRARPDGNI